MDHADIYFDGPQFVVWRLHHLEQTLGPCIRQPQDWRLYTRKGSSITSLKSAALGAILCAPPIPNFGTLWVASLFPNPERQPYINNIHGWKHIFTALASHRCTLGIGPKLALDALDPYHEQVTILHAQLPLSQLELHNKPRAPESLFAQQSSTRPSEPSRRAGYDALAQMFYVQDS
ncbi:MAG: hypothetical protein M0Z85_04420 [Gammaproteobacteria bacterium]|nr:hypothetical protein [Gammaproteobacteria bacterium]